MTAARQIYYDWIPIREQADGRLYRTINFGKTAALHMLDERLAGRTAPAAEFALNALEDTARHMLGEPQFEWLCRQLKSADQHWQLIGNQVLFAQLDLANILPEYPVNLDAWDGYRYEKYRLVDSLKQLEQRELVFLTGDTHCSWYFNIPEDEAAFKRDGSGPILAHELGAPSTSSANYDEFIKGWDTLTVARYRLFRDNPHLKYTNITDHGFLLLDSSSRKFERRVSLQ